MPKPREGESKDAFVERCMAYPDLQNLDGKARAGRCYGIWDEHAKGGAASKSLPIGEMVKFSAIAEMELDVSERCDISTITSKSVDAQGDIIMPDGLDWTYWQERGSPVHFAHNAIRVGRALWVKAKGDRWIAKTKYDSAPKGWDKSKPWLCDIVFDAVKKGTLPGKSITVLPTEEQEPNAEQRDLGAKRIISKGLVSEFSVCRAPVNQDAMVEEICKSLDAFNPQVVEDLNQRGYLDELAAEIEGAFDQLKRGDL